MASINPIITVNPPLGGQRRDLPRLAIPENSVYTLNNFLYRSGDFAVRPGHTSFASSVSAYVLAMTSYNHHTGINKMVLGATDKWWRWDTGTNNWVDITESENGLTASNTNAQVFRTFWKSAKTYLVGCNGHTDNPKMWDGVTATYSDMGGTPPKAKAMAVLANRLILGNLSAAPYQIDVSSFNDFEAGWGTTQVVNLMDTPGDIVAIRELGNLLAVVYKTDAIYLMVATSALAPFRFELKQAGITGPVSPKSIITTPIGQYFLNTEGDLLLFDGFSLSMCHPAIKAHLDETLDRNTSRIMKAFGYYDGFHREVWLFYCGLESEYPNMGIAFSLDNNAVWPVSFGGFYPSAAAMNLVESGTTIGDWDTETIGSLDFAIGTLGVTTSTVLLGSSTGQCYYPEDDRDDAGTAIPFELETGIAIPAPPRFTTVNEADHLFYKPDTTQNLTVQLGISDWGETPQYSTGKVVDLSASGRHKTSHRETGRGISLRLTGNATKRVQWHRSMIHGTSRGMR